MTLERLTPEQLNALGSMSKEIHDEYRNLGFAGFSPDPIRYLAFRQQTKNYLQTKLIVSDAGVFFMDPSRKIKYKFNPGYFFVYHDGFDQSDQQKIKETKGPLILLDNLLEFWNRQGTGLCLVADHLNHCDYLFPEQKAELARIQRLYSKEEFVINPMLQKKSKDTPHQSAVGIFDLED